MTRKPEHIAHFARQWVGTPFHHQGRVRGVGCDCIGMVMGALTEAGIKSRLRDANGAPQDFTCFDDPTYAPDPNSARLKQTLDTHLYPIPFNALAAGDVALFRIIHLPQHVGIIGHHPAHGLSLIHAYAPAGKVVEETFTASWRTRLIGAYRVPVLNVGAVTQNAVGD
jgi:NlpC/P60 family putative phage cell wall peptidase